MEHLDVSTQGLALTAKAADGIMTVKISGELDLAGADAMHQLNAWVARQADDSSLVLDLSELGFVDSSGLRMLLETSGGARPVGLLSPSTTVARLLELTGLHERFTLIASLDDPALHDLRAGPTG
jgi:anti-sigma B factor antagonist